MPQILLNYRFTCVMSFFESALKLLKLEYLECQTVLSGFFKLVKFDHQNKSCNIVAWSGHLHFANETAIRGYFFATSTIHQTCEVVTVGIYGY
jgi:hypothetical protein